MSEIVSKPMSGSYKAVFVFAIAMTVIVFFASAASNSKGQLGTLVWGYSAWLMSKQRNQQLVDVYKALIWLTSVLGGGGLLVIVFYGNSTDISITGYAIVIAAALVIDFMLLGFFRRQLIEPHVNGAGHFEGGDAEERLYATAMGEIKSKTVRDGVWAKAIVESNGDEGKAAVLYIKHRVEQQRRLADVSLVDKPAASERFNFNRFLDKNIPHIAFAIVIVFGFILIYNAIQKQGWNAW